MDASASALQAASWTANEAALRRLPLRLVHGVHVSAFAHINRLGTFARFFETPESEGRRYLAEARDMVRDAHPGLNVDIDLRCADPLTTLIELSETALTSGLCVATTHHDVAEAPSCTSSGDVRGGMGSSAPSP